MAARVIEKNPLFSAKWLKLTAVKYADETGRERVRDLRNAKVTSLDLGNIRKNYTWN